MATGRVKSCGVNLLILVSLDCLENGDFLHFNVNNDIQFHQIPTSMLKYFGIFFSANF